MTIEITPEEHIQILKALHSKKLLLGKKIRWGSKKANSFKQQAGCLKMYTYPAPPLPEFYDLQQHSDTYEAINEKRASRIEIITNLINKLEKYGE